MQKPNPKCNVHFWLREIYYFIMHLPENTEVTIQNESPTPGKDIPDKTENEIRGKHGLKQDKITQKDALKACSELYDMFSEFLDDDVLDFIKDPRCAGSRPRIVI